MKYLTIESLRLKNESYEKALSRALKILDSENPEVMAWYKTGMEVLKSKHQQELEKLDEWFQNLQFKMFGEDLPEPKPSDLREILHIRDIDKSSKNNDPYQTLFMSSLGYWYGSLGCIFIVNSVKDSGKIENVNYQICISTDLAKYLEKEGHLIGVPYHCLPYSNKQARGPNCRKCIKNSYHMPVNSLKVKKPSFYGSVKDTDLASEIWNNTLSKGLDVAFPDLPRKMKKHTGAFWRFNPEHVVAATFGFIYQNLENGNLKMERALTGLLLTDLLSLSQGGLTDLLYWKELEYTQTGWLLGDIMLPDELPRAVKKIIFKK